MGGGGGGEGKERGEGEGERERGGGEREGGVTFMTNKIYNFKNQASFQ